jgi:hypothetical protein
MVRENRNSKRTKGTCGKTKLVGRHGISPLVESAFRQGSVTLEVRAAYPVYDFRYPSLKYKYTGMLDAILKETQEFIQQATVPHSEPADIALQSVSGASAYILDDILEEYDESISQGTVVATAPQSVSGAESDMLTMEWNMFDTVFNPIGEFALDPSDMGCGDVPDTDNWLNANLPIELQIQ